MRVPSDNNARYNKTRLRLGLHRRNPTPSPAPPPVEAKSEPDMKAIEEILFAGLVPKARPRTTDHGPKK